MSKLRCFIFDLDGTLVDTREANFLAYRSSLRALGMPLTRDEYDGYFGLGMRDMLELHARRFGIEVTEDLAEACREAKAYEYLSVLSTVTILEPARTMLERLSGSVHVALATTASERNARAVLDHTNLTGLFDFMVFAEDVAETKPSPECFHRVAEHFGVEPAECAVLEDSDSGVAAAIAFGAKVLRVLK